MTRPQVHRHSFLRRHAVPPSAQDRGSSISPRNPFAVQSHALRVPSCALIRAACNLLGKQVVHSKSFVGRACLPQAFRSARKLLQGKIQRALCEMSSAALSNEGSAEGQAPLQKKKSIFPVCAMRPNARLIALFAWARNLSAWPGIQS